MVTEIRSPITGNRIVCVVFAVTIFVLACQCPAERPNIVLILCDDLGYADVGFNGATDIRTPELDKLANDGTVFTSAYVCHPFCGPSRMGLMTGRYPHEFGAPFNLAPSGLGIEKFNAKGVDVNETLISTVLQRSGYFTGAIGKWHMGIQPEFHPNQRGFDDYYGFLGGGHKYFPEKFNGIYERQKNRGVKYINEYSLPLQHNGAIVKETQYVTDGLSREAVRFVNEASKKDRPFFLYLAYNAPHSPLEATDKDLAEFSSIKDQKRRTYAAMVYAVDRGVGHITNALKANDRFDNTLIVFLSDNGGKISLGANNAPLKEGKGSTYEGGFRVPMFFHWPDHVPAGQHYPHPITSLDFYPTFAGLAEARIPDGKVLSGKDIWDDFTKGTSPRTGESIYAIRHREGFSDVGIRRDEWKACRTSQRSWQLFNMNNDLGESRDLSAEYPGLLKDMVAEARIWSESHTAPEWFESRKTEKEWQSTAMPKYDETFRVK